MENIKKFNDYIIDEYLDKLFNNLDFSLNEENNITIDEHFKLVTYRQFDIEDDKIKFRVLLDEVYTILDDAYLPIGGFKGFASHNDMKKKCVEAKIVYYDNIIVAVSVYNNYMGGNKCVGIAATQNTKYHKHGVFGVKYIIYNDATEFEKYYWLEASNKIEEYARECGSFNIPNGYAEILFENKRVILLDDGYHYTRHINGNIEKKTLFGFPDIDTYNSVVENYEKEYKEWIDNLLNRMPVFNSVHESVSCKKEIDCSKVIVDAFISFYEDEKADAFTEGMLDIFNTHINNVDRLLKTKQFGKFNERVYKICVEDGKNISSKYYVIKKY